MASRSSTSVVVAFSVSPSLLHGDPSSDEGGNECRFECSLLSFVSLNISFLKKRQCYPKLQGSASAAVLSLSIWISKKGSLLAYSYFPEAYAKDYIEISDLDRRKFLVNIDDESSKAPSVCAGTEEELICSIPMQWTTFCSSASTIPPHIHLLPFECSFKFTTSNLIIGRTRMPPLPERRLLFF